MVSTQAHTTFNAMFQFIRALLDVARGIGNFDFAVYGIQQEARALYRPVFG